MTAVVNGEAWMQLKVSCGVLCAGCVSELSMMMYPVQQAHDTHGRIPSALKHASISVLSTSLIYLPTKSIPLGTSESISKLGKLSPPLPTPPTPSIVIVRSI